MYFPIIIEMCTELSSFGIDTTCEEGSIRLVGSYDVREGRVEYCSNNTWYSVCGDGWQEPEANVVCSTLGYSTSLGKGRAHSGIQLHHTVLSFHTQCLLFPTLAGALVPSCPWISSAVVVRAS